MTVSEAAKLVDCSHRTTVETEEEGEAAGEERQALPLTQSHESFSSLAQQLLGVGELGLRRIVSPSGQ